jgi:hypothetical protein
MTREAQQAARLVRVEVAQALQDAFQEIGRGANRALEAFVEGMSVGAKEDMRKVHVAIAKEMRASVQDAYARTVLGARKVPTYRRFNRFQGQLFRLVRRNDLVRADEYGISYINAAAMDKEAAHWRRLNFGAGAAAGEQPGPFTIRLFGQAEINVDFGEAQRPSPAFVLPRGFFLQGGQWQRPNAGLRGHGSIGAFYPDRMSPYRPRVTEGIRGRHFLEAGLEVLERELPIRYADLLNLWIQAGGRKARAISRLR